MNAPLPDQARPPCGAGLQPFQQRVVAEKEELGDRLSKLLAFFQTDAFAALPEAERSRLRNQARFMDGYAAVLTERIEAFKAAQPARKQYRPADIADIKWATTVEAFDDKVNVWARMADGKEIRTSFVAPFHGARFDPQKLAAEAILAAANKEAP